MLKQHMQFTVAYRFLTRPQSLIPRWVMGMGKSEVTASGKSLRHIARRFHWVKFHNVSYTVRLASLRD